ETEVPQRCVEDLTFLNENLPTDDLVASRSVPGECNAMNCELSVLININGNVYQLFLFIKILDGYRSEIDIAPRSVEFFKIVKAGAQLRLVKDLFRDQAQQGLDENVIEFLGAQDFHIADFVPVVFFNSERDLVPIDFFLPEWQWHSERKRRL